MQYFDAYKYDKPLVEKLLKSEKEEELVKGMIFTVFGSNDYALAKKIVTQFIDSDSSLISEKANECVGHLVRIFGLVNHEHLKHTEKLLNSQEDNYVDEILSDIWTYHIKIKNNLEKFRPYKNSYKYWKFQEITEKSLEKHPEKGIETLEKLIGTTNHIKLEQHILDCIKHIKLFR